MSHLPPNVQAVVEYASAVGHAVLTHGRTSIAAWDGYDPTPAGESLDGEPSGGLTAKVGPYTLRIIPAPGISPLAVAERVERCKALLRALAGEPVPFIPPGDGGTGSGPAPSELRAWVPAARGRC